MGQCVAWVNPALLRRLSFFGGKGGQGGCGLSLLQLVIALITFGFVIYGIRCIHPWHCGQASTPMAKTPYCMVAQGPIAPGCVSRSFLKAMRRLENCCF